jgi:hypothetical protein
MPKNTENILFTKGVQYVNVQSKGFLKWKSAAKLLHFSDTGGAL